MSKISFKPRMNKSGIYLNSKSINSEKLYLKFYKHYQQILFGENHFPTLVTCSTFCSNSARLFLSANRRFRPIGSGFWKKNQMVIYVAIGELSSQICLDKPVLSAAGASPELAWSFVSGAGTFSQQSPRHSRGSRAQSRGPVAKYFHRIFNKILFSEFFLNYCSSGSGGHLVIVKKICI